MIPAEIKRAQIELALQYVSSPAYSLAKAVVVHLKGRSSEQTIGSLTVKHEQFTVLLYQLRQLRRPSNSDGLQLA